MTKDLTPDKPFKTFDEQIEILKDRNLIINNDEFAKHVILTFSYYDLINGYKECFMVDDTFRPNISIEYLYDFCRFDHNFQNIVFQYSVITETLFKTALAYVISKKYGVFQNEYLSNDNYIRGAKNKSKINKILNDIRKTYNKKDEKYIDEPTKHYFYEKNHIPPWILFKNVTFNNAINLYSILKREDKLEVCNLILDIHLNEDQKLELFKNCLSIIRKFRNKIAHNLKFISYKTDKIHLSKKVLKKTPYNFLFENNTYNDVYSMIIALNIILNDESLIFEFNNSLVKLFNNYRAFNKYIIIDYCKITGIPSNLDVIIDEFVKEYFTTNIKIDHL